MIYTSQIITLSEQDDDVRVYHTRQDLTYMATTSREAIYSIPGIESVYVSAYSLRIGKAVMYKWEEIEPQIAAILTRTQSGTKETDGNHEQ